MKAKKSGILLFVMWFVCMGMIVNAMNKPTKAYKAKSAEPIKPIVVSLKDQFDKDAHKVELIAIEYFGNPTLVAYNSKKFPIVDPNAHLTWYKFDPPKPVIKWKVKINNGFGPQTLVLGEATHLLVPTEKIGENSAIPKKLNHFKAYKVLEHNFKKSRIVIQDQFMVKPVTVEVHKPLFFCNPVSKNGEPISDKLTHLTCYSIEGDVASIPKSKRIRNQFKDNVLYFGDGVMFCAPTKKLEVFK